AIYRVTGATQRLAGPAMAASVGAVSFGSHYFSGANNAAPSRLYLVSQLGAVMFSADAPTALDGSCISSSIAPPQAPSAPAPIEPAPAVFGDGCGDADTTDTGVAAVTAPDPGIGPWGGGGGSIGSF